MILLLIIGILALLFAFALFFFPKQLRSMNESGNRIMFTDERAIIYRKRAGILLLFLSIIFFILGYLTKG